MSVPSVGPVTALAYVATLTPRSPTAMKQVNIKDC